MVTPRPGLAPTPPLATPFVLCNGRLCVSGTGKPLRFHVPDVLCDPLSFLGLRGGIRPRCLVSQLARVDDQKAALGHVLSPIRVLHGHAAADTVPMPVSRRLLTRTARFCEQEGQGTVLLAPRFQLLPHGTGARDQRDEPHPLFET